jgi:hypothetical protein
LRVSRSLLETVCKSEAFCFLFRFPTDCKPKGRSLASATIGGRGFIGWLLVKGIKVPERDAFAPAVA